MRDDFKKQNPDLVLAFLKDSSRSRTTFKQNPKDVVETMTKFLGVDEAAVMRSLNTFHPVPAKEQLTSAGWASPASATAPVVQDAAVAGRVPEGRPARSRRMPKDMNGLVDKSFVAQDGVTAASRRTASAPPRPARAVKARFEGVSKTLRPRARGAVQALEPITLDLAENAFVCLVGPSGCGKSTLLNIMAGFETPTAAGR